MTEDKNKIISIKDKIRIPEENILNVDSDEVSLLINDKKIKRVVFEATDVPSPETLKKRLIYKALLKDDEDEKRKSYYSNFIRVTIILFLSFFTIYMISYSEKFYELIYGKKESIVEVRENYLLFKKDSKQKEQILKNKLDEFGLRYSEAFFKNSSIFYTFNNKTEPLINVTINVSGEPAIVTFLNKKFNDNSNYIYFNELIIEKINLSNNRAIIISASSREALDVIKNIIII